MEIQDPKVAGAMLIAVGRTMIANDVNAIEVMGKEHDPMRLAIFKTVLEQEDSGDKYDLTEAVYLLEEELSVVIGGV